MKQTRKRNIKAHTIQRETATEAQGLTLHAEMERHFTLLTDGFVCIEHVKTIESKYDETQMRQTTQTQI